MPFDEMKNIANAFFAKVFNELERNHFILEKHWHIGHLCFRTSTQKNYLSIKGDFESFSKLLIESEMNGRLISTFKLDDPIAFDDREIDLIEVPAPKKDTMVVDGFEHLEVVCELKFDKIKNRYSQFRFDNSGLVKDFIQELKFTLNGFAIKLFGPLNYPEKKAS